MSIGAPYRTAFLLCFITACVFSVVIPEHSISGCDDHDISDDAQTVGYLSHDQKSQQGGEDDLRVVVDGDLFCRGVGVGRCYAELRHCRTQTRSKQHKELEPRHRVEVEHHERKRGKGRERRKEEHNIITLYALLGRSSHEGVCRTCAHSAYKACNGWNKLCVLKARLYHEHSACKGGEYYQPLRPVGFFFKQRHGKDDRKERGHLVEQRGV